MTTSSKTTSIARRRGKQRVFGLRARSAAVLALLLSGLLLGAGPALAHDRLERTNPGDGKSVKTLPDSIELEYNETVLALGSVVKVISPDGDVTDGRPKVVDNIVTQQLMPGSPAGKYEVQWRVTSSDGHPISGEFSFTAKAGNEPAAAATTEPDQPSATASATSEAPATADDSAAAPASTTSEDSGGTSTTLVITLIVLALVVIGAVLYLFVFAPKRSGEE